MIRAISTITTTPMFVAAGLQVSLEPAQASQGSRAMRRAASATMQPVMAIVVYGGSALLPDAGLVCTARPRKIRS